MVGPNGFVKASMVFPETELSAADAYGQPPKVERQDAMKEFGEHALELLHSALTECSGA